MARRRTDFTNVKCCICGTGETYIRHGIPDWRRYYGNSHDKEWDMVSFACSKCNAKIRNRLPDSTNNILKSVRSCRTGNHNPNHESTKAYKSQKLTCELYGWIDLNEELDNYDAPIDCYDPRTMSYHQVQMRYFSSKYLYWEFGSFKGEWKKKCEDMICICISEDGKIVERIYKFPWKEIMEIISITIYKSHIAKWCEKYRIIDEEELKNANEIWKKLNRL